MLEKAENCCISNWWGIHTLGSSCSAAFVYHLNQKSSIMIGDSKKKLEYYILIHIGINMMEMGPSAAVGDKIKLVSFALLVWVFFGSWQVRSVLFCYDKFSCVECCFLSRYWEHTLPERHLFFGIIDYESWYATRSFDGDATLINQISLQCFPLWNPACTYLDCMMPKKPWNYWLLMQSGLTEDNLDLKSSLPPLA